MHKKILICAASLLFSNYASAQNYSVTDSSIVCKASENIEDHVKKIEGNLGTLLNSPNIKIMGKVANGVLPRTLGANDEYVKIWTQKIPCRIFIDDPGLTDFFITKEDGSKEFDFSKLGVVKIKIDDQEQFLWHSEDIAAFEKKLTTRTKLHYENIGYIAGLGCPREGAGINIFSRIEFLYTDKSKIYISPGAKEQERFYPIRKINGKNSVALSFQVEDGGEYLAGPERELWTKAEFNSEKKEETNSNLLVNRILIPQYDAIQVATYLKVGEEVRAPAVKEVVEEIVVEKIEVKPTEVKNVSVKKSGN